ncbi:hypothetical protein BDR04DRAFT_1163952 [Suillus decipiens]|nr:hypothetical protein BDR04DRAFT_1163952 [Suillus decipiens]
MHKTRIKASKASYEYKLVLQILVLLLTRPLVDAYPTRDLDPDIINAIYTHPLMLHPLPAISSLLSHSPPIVCRHAILMLSQYVPVAPPVLSIIYYRPTLSRFLHLM